MPLTCSCSQLEKRHRGEDNSEEDGVSTFLGAHNNSGDGRDRELRKAAISGDWEAPRKLPA